MDYLPMNLPDGNHPVHFFTPVLGALDKLAIRYGYSTVSPPASSAPRKIPLELQSLLETATTYEHCLDEEYHARLDPLCEVHELSAEPLKFYASRLDRIVALQKTLLNDSVAPGGPYWNYGAAARHLWLTADRIGYKLTFWIGGANTSFEHRGAHGSDAGRDAIRAIPADIQREALGMIFNILRPQSSGLLPPPDSLPFLVTQTGRDGVTGMDPQDLVRRTQSFVVKALMDQQTLLHLDMMSSLGGLAVPGFLERIVSVVFNPDTMDKEDWDLQKMMAESLDHLDKEDKLPESIAPHVSMCIGRIHRNIGAALEFYKVPQNAPTQLLVVHLSRLHSYLSSLRAEVLSEAAALPGEVKTLVDVVNKTINSTGENSSRNASQNATGKDADNATEDSLAITTHPWLSATVFLALAAF
jgi:hypothetical protein